MNRFQTLLANSTTAVRPYNEGELTSVVTIVHARRMFAACQIDDDVSEMVYAEFIESMAGIS